MKSRHNKLRGAVARLDSCLSWQKNPGNTVRNPNRYYCARKEKFFGLLIAIWDTNRKFLSFEVSCTPTTDDSLAGQSTEMGQKVVRGKIPEPFYLLGDNAFTATRSMIVSGDEDDFNFEQSSHWINIECAFGELIRHWGIIWWPLEMGFQKRTAVLGAVYGSTTIASTPVCGWQRSWRWETAGSRLSQVWNYLTSHERAWCTCRQSNEKVSVCKLWPKW